ncbi:MAG: nucleotide exchange factor GrpE [Eubacteriales bacterium]|nr:nucleotide exchange factor GrpE [Eubacteriales bacterium]
MKKEIDNEIKKDGNSEKNVPPDTENEAIPETEQNTRTDSEDAEGVKNEKQEKETPAGADDKAGAETGAAREKDSQSKPLAELNEKYIRLYAEYENYRKRSEKEKSESFQAGIISAVSAFVPLLDNLDRALTFEPENEGLILLCKLVNEIFDKLGIKEIEADGKPFDPNLHNAIMHEEDPEKGENTVSLTFQKGYTLNGKIIRHAVVKVVN